MSQAPLQSEPVSIESAREMRGGAVGRLVLGVGLMLLAVLACGDAWLDILRIVQKDEEASHIILVPLVFAWLVWARRGRLKGWVPEPTVWGCAIILAGTLLWIFGYVKAMQVFWHLGAVVTLVGAFVTVRGLRVVKLLWPSFVVLLFLLPVPGVIRQPVALHLQNISAQATQFVMLLIGHQIERYGNLLVVNGYEVGIAEACNGMRMVSMLVLVVFAFVFAHDLRRWARIVLMLAAIPIAVLCNILRLVPTVLAYGYAPAGFADQLHDWLGWGVAFVAYLGLIALLALMRWLLLPVDQPVRPSYDLDDEDEPGSASGYARTTVWTSRLMWPVGLSLAALVGVFVGAQTLPDGASTEGYHAAVREVASEIPREVGAWVATDAEVPPAAIALLHPNVMMNRQYRNEATGRSFYLMLIQCADARDMEGHYPPNCYPTSGWEPDASKPIKVPIGGLPAGGMSYRYHRLTASGLMSIEVVNLILIPDSGFVTTMQEIRRLAGSIDERYYGAAQVQFVFSEQWSEEEREAVIREVGATLEPVMRTVLIGSGAGTEPEKNK